MNQRLNLDSFLPKNVRYLALAAAIMVFLVIVLGGMVRVTESGGACPDWPTCLGRWTPPVGDRAAIDYLHRFVTLLAIPLLAAAAGVAWLRYGKEHWISRPLYAALALLAGQIAVGAFVSLVGIPNQDKWISAMHLSLALAILGLASVSTVAAFYCERSQTSESWSGRLIFRSPFARLSLLALGMVFLLLVSGALMAGAGASQACAAWPVCNPLQTPGDPAAWINFVHRLTVGLSSMVMLILLVKAWRTQRSQPVILVASTAATVLFFAQALLGAKLVTGFPVYLLGLHEATAVAVWAVMVVQISAVGLAARTDEEEIADRASILGRKGLGRDLLMLTKPIVAALLLVTTFAGMVIGAQAWPPLNIVFWTLLGGFMAAGGSGAINQYIDRFDDAKMQRTQKRPIPAGRLTPAEGLAFGVAMTLASFYLMVAFVNFLAALLSLAGIVYYVLIYSIFLKKTTVQNIVIGGGAGAIPPLVVYYVLIYSIFLKKTTVQNIVIGGGAGAIPPLVGWAAATGSLNVPSLFLFAVIFMWTPPHFWALALVRRKDYARAGVPMLPVIRGEKETRWQIFLYTLELVGLTLLLPLFGLGGSIYLIGAALLGLWLLYAAWKVWKQGGNKLAWKMYRYSSMYLAFIFLVLMVDRLL
jgi:heme o synthase